MNFKEDVKKHLGYVLSDEQLNQLGIYYTFLVEYNHITNLTRITDEQDVFYKHFYDSMSMHLAVDMTTINKMCDMGSGAGFPSIPLKIMYPHLKITIIDALGKRITFLEQLIDRLKLDHVTLVHDRVEQFAVQNQHIFELVTARAFGHLSMMLEMAMPMLVVDGIFVAMKAQNYQDELNEAKNATSIMKSSIERIVTFELPHNYGFRSNIVFRKNEHVKGYPRHFSQISKKPL